MKEEEFRSLKIEFTYNPEHVGFRYIQCPVSAELYKKIFQMTGAKPDDVVFDCFNHAIVDGNPLVFLETISRLSRITMIIHDKEMFVFQFLEEGKGESPDNIEAIINKILYSHVASEGCCHGLRPPVNQDIRLKKTLPEICDKLGIPTPEIIPAASLMKDSINYKEAIETLNSWKKGFYLKNSRSSNGRDMVIYVPESAEEMKGYVKAVLDTIILNENRDELIIARRVETPHPKYASHYGVFTFFDGNKAHILSAILCYNLEDRYTVHGKKTGRLPITGDYLDAKKSSDERKILKAHGLKDIALPAEVEDIALKVSTYAGKKGRLFLCSEIIEDKDHNYYLVDVNGVPGFGAIKTTEFAPGSDPTFNQVCRKTAEMILQCYDKKD